MYKKIRRYGAVFIMLILLCTSAFAEGGAAVMRAPSVSAKAGHTVEISVELGSNPGLAAWLVELSWDASVFSLAEDDVKPGNSFASGTMFSKADKPGHLIVNWYNVKNVTKNGAMFTVKLKAADDAVTGDYEIGLSCSAENTINIDEELVPVSCEPVRVHIKGTAPAAPSAEVTQTPEKAATEPSENTAVPTEPDTAASVPDSVTATVKGGTEPADGAVAPAEAETEPQDSKIPLGIPIAAGIVLIIALIFLVKRGSKNV